MVAGFLWRKLINQRGEGMILDIVLGILGVSAVIFSAGGAWCHRHESLQLARCSGRLSDLFDCLQRHRPRSAAPKGRTMVRSILAQIAFLTCRAHYPGGAEQVHLVGSFPALRGLPRHSRGAASTTSLSRPAQASRVLRPAKLLTHQKWALSRGSSPTGCPLDRR